MTDHRERQSPLYKHTSNVDYLGDFPGADVERNLLRVIVEEGDITLSDEITVDSITSTPTITDDGTFDINSLPTPVTVTDDGALDINSLPEPLTITENSALDVSAATVTVNNQDSPDHPQSETTGHDLIGTGDLTLGPLSVARASKLVITATSTDGNAWSASLDWVDSNGNTFLSESATDVGLSSVTDGSATLDRKGPNVTITFTDESGGSSNNVNVYADTHR
jgi:hypothetical protein